VLGRPGAEQLPRIPGRMIFKSPDCIIPVQGAYVPPDVLEAWIRRMSGFPIDIPTDYVDEVETRTKKAREQALIRAAKQTTSGVRTDGLDTLDITDISGGF
jgi:hypothetical protein